MERTLLEILAVWVVVIPVLAILAAAMRARHRQRLRHRRTPTGSLRTARLFGRKRVRFPNP